MQGIGVVEGDARTMVRWRKILCFGNPKRVVHLSCQALLKFLFMLLLMGFDLKLC